ncbi:hypothetical protein HY2_14100 [Hyphomonas pacifica]|nr:hypothetical protein HY2_14100 [Hyphomonas pacifica]
MLFDLPSVRAGNIKVHLHQRRPQAVLEWVERLS